MKTNEKTRRHGESFSIFTLNLYLMKKIITQKCGAKLQPFLLSGTMFKVKKS